MRKKILLALLTGLAVGGGFACVSEEERSLEEAKFLVDRCNPVNEETLTDCQEAVDRADEVQIDDPTNVQAALLESSARLGLARFDFLTFLADLAELATSGIDDFSRFRRFISDYEEDELNEAQGLTGLEIELDQMRAPAGSAGQGAIDVFDAILAALDADDLDDDGTAVDRDIRQAAFQAGLLRALDGFIRPVKLAAGGIGNVEANITDAETALVLDDFLDSDNNFELGGGDEDELSDILRPIRENYCRCALQAGGFSQNCLQDMMRCELYDGNSIEGDYNDNGQPEISDCIDLLNPDEVDACGGVDSGTYDD